MGEAIRQPTGCIVHNTIGHVEAAPALLLNTIVPLIWPVTKDAARVSSPLAVAAPSKFTRRSTEGKRWSDHSAMPLTEP